MEPILQCCQFRVFLVENYIFENISKFWKKLNFSFFNWKGNKIVSSLQKKSFESDKRLESNRTSKLKNHKNFATFLKKNFNFAVKLNLGLKNQKTNLRLMHFFILKPKMISVFFSDRPFRRGNVFHKNWQYCKMG